MLNETAKTTNVFSSSPTNQSPLEESVFSAPQGTGNVQMFSLQSITIMKKEPAPLLFQERRVEKPIIAGATMHGLSKAAKVTSL